MYARADGSFLSPEAPTDDMSGACASQWTHQQILDEVRGLCEVIRSRNYTQADRLRWAVEVEAIVKQKFGLGKKKTCKDLREPLNSDEATLVMRACRAADNFFYILCPNLFQAMLHGKISAQDVDDIYHGRWQPPDDLK